MLNSGQLSAVESDAKQTLVLAGAGTGKTKVIVSRIEKIVKSGVPPEKIVATTFTNKAAAELKARLFLSIGEDAYRIYCGTFHKISSQFLRKHAETIGLNPNFQVLHEDDQRQLIKRILKEKGQEGKAAQIADLISKVKENGLLSKQNAQFKAMFTAYEDELNANHYLDYSDLIMKAIFLFEQANQSSLILAEHILIDEYQDINNAQYNWIKLISQGRNLFCVGDEDQAIYSFRGSSIEYIQKFHQDFPEANIVKLEENYRSGKEILKAATNLIDKNPKQFKKKLIAANQEILSSVKINKVYNEWEEAKLVARLCAKWIQENDQYKIGVLVRTNMQVFAIEQALIESKIPYVISGGKKFYLKKEIQDLIAYLKILVFPNDFLAFARIINVPKRNIGESRLQKLLDAMKSLNCSFENALTTLLSQLPKNASEKCKILLMQIQTWRALNRSGLGLDALLDKILDDIEYKKQEEYSETQTQSLKNLKSLLTKSPTIEHFLENILFVEEESEQEPIQIMTIHGAKGLEFDVVVAPGWEEDVLPSVLARDSKEIEEERRLAYIAITRAKISIEIIYGMSRRINGQYKNQMPSRFIFDLS